MRRGVGEADAGLVAQHERGAERVDGRRRERLGPLRRSPGGAARRGTGCRGRRAPCGKPGSMSPEGSEIENAGPSTSVTTPPSPPSDALAVDRPRLRHERHATAPRRADRRLVCSDAMKIAEIAPPWFAVPPTGYGGIELVVALLADGLAERGHDVTLFASGGSQTKAKLVSPLVDPPDPGAARQPLVRRLPRARRRTSTISDDDFDVVHDHSGIVGPRDGCAAARPTRRWCTRCTDRGPSRRVATTRCSHEHVHLVAISESQRADNPDVRYAGVVHNGIDLDDYPFRDEKDDFLVYIGRANPDKGPTLAIEVARRAGLPLAMVVKKNEPFERAYWDEIVAPLLNDEVEVLRGDLPRAEGRPARARPGDGLPDPVARAVRPRDGGGDGVRHAGRRLPRGRRGRAGRERRHRLPARLDRRPRRRGGQHRRVLADRLPDAGGGALQRGGDGGGVRSPLRVAAGRAIRPFPGFHYGRSANRMAVP